MEIQKTQIETPFGLMFACATDKGVCLLEFDDRKNVEDQFKRLIKSTDCEIIEEESPFFTQLRSELTEYFEAKRTEFTVPLDLVGTDFQKQVWAELLKIPYGQTISYLQLAKRIGDTNAVRAVANANGLNKVAIIVPCHRVIGTDGSLVGYAGGIDRKRKLLEIEGYYNNLLFKN